MGKTRPRSVSSWLAFNLVGLGERASKILRVPPIFTRQEVRLTTMHAAYDGGKASRELGFVPKTPLPEGMRRSSFTGFLTAISPCSAGS